MTDRKDLPTADEVRGILKGPTPPTIVTHAADPAGALRAFIAQELENWNFHVYNDSPDSLRVSSGFGAVLTVTVKALQVINP